MIRIRKGNKILLAGIPASIFFGAVTAIGASEFYMTAIFNSVAGWTFFFSTHYFAGTFEDKDSTSTKNGE